MRKCDACGYLLLGDGDCCNHCGAPLPTASVGAGVAPPAVAPPAAAGPPPPAPVAPTAPAPSPVWQSGAPTSPLGGIAPPAPPPPPSGPPRDVWSAIPQPTIRVSPPRRKRIGVTIGAGIVAVLAAVLAYGAYARNQAPPDTSSYVDGHGGIDYDAPDGSYAAQFPQQPVVDTKPITVGSVQMMITTASVETDNYEMVTASIALPVAIPAAQVDKTLDDSVDAFVNGMGGKNTSTHPFRRGGLPAIEATFDARDSYAARTVIMYAGGHLDIIAVHSRTGVDKLFHALDKSFVPYVGE